MTLLSRRHFAAATFCLGLASLLVPMAALAESNDPEAQRLAQKRSAERYNVEVPGASLRAGGAAIWVDAPMLVVRKVVTEYSKYASYIPRFQKSKVIGKKDGRSDVYLQVPILNGAATVWSLTRVEPPVKDGANGELIEGKMLEGNVNDLRSWFRLRPVDDHHTILKLELLISLKLPLPGKVVTPELEFAADQAVTAIRDRAEARHKQSSKDASAKRLPQPLAPLGCAPWRRLPSFPFSVPRTPTHLCCRFQGKCFCGTVPSPSSFCPPLRTSPPPRGWVLGGGARPLSLGTSPPTRPALRPRHDCTAPPAALAPIR
ncbi:MAG: hypothetical protein RMJ98_05030 [Myxococcales bacterium]|nr:hypothetical protein [Polyangiaceae bacterium]MDW8248652.1 hypothetical protein [Myxococcales bacterium]